MSSFMPLDFGTIAGYNMVLSFFEISRNVSGEVFELTSNWVTEGSKISFDDGMELDLIPQSPYYIHFNRKVTIKVKNPYRAPGAGAIVTSDRLQGVVFTNKSDYFLVKGKPQFGIVYCADNNIGFRLTPTLGGSHVQILHTCSNTAVRNCVKITKHPYLGTFSNDYLPCIGYITYDHTGGTGSNYNLNNDEKFISCELNGEDLGFAQVYASGATDSYYTLIYSNVGNEAYNESLLYARFPNLTINTVYTFTFQAPKHGRNVFYRISDANGTPFQGISYTVFLPQLSLIGLVSGSGVSSIGGQLTNQGAFCRVRITVTTNLTLTNDCVVNIAWKH